MKSKSIEQINTGDAEEFAKTLSESDVYLYAGITGDFNPAHVNADYAGGTFFRSRIAHGLLTAGLISTVIGTRLPGPGSIYISQELRFRAPVYFGDTITARVEVKETDPGKNRVTLKTTCFNQEGKAVVDGQAVVSPPLADKKKAG